MAAAAGGGAGAGRVVTAAELATHNTKESCWVALHGRVYDLTTFLADHPGGARIIVREAGRDGTAAFQAVHPKDIIARLGLEQKLFVGRYDGPAAPTAAAPAAAVHAAQKTAAVKAAAPTPRGGSKPPLEAMMNVFDFEAVAADVMAKEAWDYYSSGADDELTLRENRSVYQRVWVAPRVMVNVKRVHSATTLLGTSASFPLYISATALARLAHPDGEQALVRAARSAGIPYMLPTLSSCSLDEMLAAADLKQQTLWTQLYVNTNRAATEDYVRRAEAGGCRALFITVDAPQLGRREKDMRNKFTAKAADVQAEADAKGQVKRSEGTARAISAFIDPALSWADLPWFRSITRMPIVLKGVQCAADALLAVEHGCAGVVLSNHGGRQMDTSRSALEILAEVMRALRARGWQHRIEVYVDGGIRRGSDIFKALALGAKAVGVGRPVLYGLAGYGQAGVERVLEMFRDELHTAMRQCGTPAICDINESLLAGTRNLSDHVVPAPADHLSLVTYKPLIALSKL